MIQDAAPQSLLVTGWLCAGYSAVSVLSSRGRLTPLRMGFNWDAASGRYALDPLLSAVEPPTAALLDLPKLAKAAATYLPSRNRQTHLYAVNERANAHSIALKRLFLRWLTKSSRPATCAIVWFRIAFPQPCITPYTQPVLEKQGTSMPETRVQLR